MTSLMKLMFQVNDVVQLGPKCGQFAGCFMVVTEPKSFGAQGFVQVPGKGQAFYRVTFENCELIGNAAFILEEATP